MRVKISLVRNPSSNNSIPLHHQKLVSTCIEDFMKELPVTTEFYNFSSLKGTSKVKNGFMRFLSSKITLVVSADSDEFIQQLVNRIFEEQVVLFGRLELMPRSYEIIPVQDYETRMKYVCISPIILVDPVKDPDTSQLVIDPSSHQFSDLLFNSLMSKMEKSGFTVQELDEFAEFEAIPDHAYINKIVDAGKKFARFYKDNDGNSMIGYLIPFTLHAHHKVHKFVLDTGIGVLNNQGYGMVDIVREDHSFDY
jgi:CRISPR-associated endoribonuclease Cas6